MGTGFDKRLRSLRSGKLGSTLADKARELAAKKGMELPTEPTAKNLVLRREIADELATTTFNVTAALRARSPDNTPEQLKALARGRIARIERDLKEAPSKRVEVFSERQKKLVEDELRRAEAIKGQAQQRLERARLKAERAVKRAAELERKAAARLEAAREKERSTKPKRQPYGNAKYAFESQRQPQIPAVLFGTAQAWVFGAIDAYKADFWAEHSVKIETPTLVRRALEEMLSKPSAIEPQAKAPGKEIVLRSTRLPVGSEGLLDQLRHVSASKGVRDSDVIRGAIAGWLIGKGYGRKKNG